MICYEVVSDRIFSFTDYLHTERFKEVLFLFVNLQFIILGKGCHVHMHGVGVYYVRYEL